VEIAVISTAFLEIPSVYTIEEATTRSKSLQLSWRWYHQLSHVTDIVTPVREHCLGIDVSRLRV
jgi:hypothetical protein